MTNKLTLGVLKEENTLDNRVLFTPTNIKKFYQAGILFLLNITQD